MENVIKINNDWLFSDKHPILTQKGFLKANELQCGDKIITLMGKTKIREIEIIKIKKKIIKNNKDV